MSSTCGTCRYRPARASVARPARWCSPSSSTRRCTRKRSSTCGTACRSRRRRRPQATSRAPEVSPPGRSGFMCRWAARRRGRLIAPRFRLACIMMSAILGRCAGLHASSAQTPHQRQRFLEFVEAGGHRDDHGGRLTTGSGAQSEGGASAVLGANRSGLVLARDVRTCPAAGSRGRCTSVWWKPPCLHHGVVRLPTESEFQRAGPWIARRPAGVSVGS